MSIKNQIEKDFIEAYKEKDAFTSGVLRLLKSSIKNTEIANKNELTDDETIAVLRKELKQRKETAAEYTKANKEEMAEKEILEAQVIEKYLPKQLDKDQLNAAVEEAIANVNATSIQDMGKVMAWLKDKFGSNLDGAEASNMVKEKLIQK